MPRPPVRALPLAAGLALFAVVAAIAGSRLTLSEATGGSRHRVSMAYHLWKHGVVSSSSADQARSNSGSRIFFIVLKLSPWVS